VTAPALITTDVRQNTDEWLALRRTGVTASEMPVIAGNRPGLVELWAYKSGLIEREDPDPATQELYDIGHALEPVIADLYSRKAKRPVRRVTQMIRHPEHEWLFASLDRVSAVKGERIIVELKFAPNRRWDDGVEAVPADVQDQVQTQMLVSGYPMAHIAVLMGGRVDWHEVPADREYQDALLRMALRFRQQVLTGQRPDIDGSESTRKALTRMHPSDTLDMIDPPTTELDGLAADLRAAKAAAKAAIAEQDRIENVIRAVLGDHEGVESETYRLTWTQNKPSRKTDWKAVAADLRAFLLSGEEPPADINGPAFADQIEAKHTTTTEGARVLRTRFLDEETSKWY
jgi:putative phage-type endonuclease